MKKFNCIMTALLASVLCCACYTWYDEKIPMDTKTPKINLSDLFYKEKEITSLETPKQLIVSQGMYGNSIKLRWDEVPYAASYRLERAIMEPEADGITYTIPEEGDFEVLNKYVWANTYTDFFINPDYQKHYYYRISAENVQKGLDSSEYTTVSNDSSGWLLSPPKSIDTGKGESPDHIRVEWSPVPNAVSYMIYRGEKPDGIGMEFLDSVKSNRTSYNNTLMDYEKGVEFYYKVCAVLSNGEQSAFTGLSLGFSSKEGEPEIPQNIKVVNGKGESRASLTISWDAVSKDGYNIKYALYRTSSADSLFVLVNNGITSSASTVVFEDKSTLKPGIKYYYYVQTIAEKNDETKEIVKSQFSKAESEDCCGWLLSPPNNCEVTDSEDNTKALLSWTPSIGSDVVNYQYKVYSSDTLDGDFTELVFIQEQLTEGADGNVSYKVDRRPYYTISAVNGSVESIQSSVVAPCPKAPENVTASKTSALDGLDKYEANTNGVYPVKITWKAPVGDNPYGYYVYRSAKPDSSYRKITDEPITDALEYIDNNETARAGSYYYYKVVSVNMLRQGKNSNEPTEDSKGYGALTREQWFREYNKTVKKSQDRLTLMHKSGTGALGSESVNGGISGSLAYKAEMAGLGARITMHYTDYAEFYIGGDEANGVYFLLTGDTNTTANMSANGTMDGTNRAHKDGMYPGYAKYDKLEIKGGGAGGGYYIVCTMDKNENTVLAEGNVDWVIGEE